MCVTNGVRFMLVLIISMNLSQIGISLECYGCTSRISHKCGNESDTLAITEICYGKMDACVKIENPGVVTRRCGIIEVCQKIGGRCNACTTNLCNSSSSAAASIIIPCLIGLIVIKYFS